MLAVVRDMLLQRFRHLGRTIAALADLHAAYVSLRVNPATNTLLRGWGADGVVKDRF
jgi:hypothetical protein